MPKTKAEPTTAVIGAKPRTARARTPHLPHLEREAGLQALLAQLREDKTPSWPADFCRRAKITKSTLRSFPELADEVNEYGWQTATSRMRPSPRTARTPVRPPNALGSTRAQAEHRAWAKEVPKLRGALAEARRALTDARAREEALAERAALRGRLLEVLIARVVTPKNDVAELTEDVLAHVRRELAPEDPPPAPPPRADRRRPADPETGVEGPPPNSPADNPMGQRAEPSGSHDSALDPRELQTLRSLLARATALLESKSVLAAGIAPRGALRADMESAEADA